ncbi:MAG: hypothetical protein IKK33_06925 [Lachnospiraceae bacterium]|nr:hypothetical protein [Lachnospiraceae bacterium]
MGHKMKKLVTIVFAILASGVAYIVLHELGHMIIMLSAGAKITEFSILTAHVTSVGGSYNNLSDLWLHVNGVAFPVIALMIYMLLYSKKTKNMFYRIFSFVFSVCTIGTMGAWVFIPFLYVQGNAPVGDDVTDFLYNFTHDHHPLLVSGVALFIMTVAIAIMIKKGIVKNYILEIRSEV